jgi:hypothetical protein
MVSLLALYSENPDISPIHQYRGVFDAVQRKATIVRRFVWPDNL